MSEAHRYIGESHTPDLYCPSCGSHNDGMTVVSREPDTRPEGGSMGVCVYCAAVLTFDGSRLLLATQAEIAELDEPNRLLIQLMREVARKRREEAKRS